MTAASIRQATVEWRGLGPTDRARSGPERIAICAGALGELTSRLQDLGYPVDPMVVACAEVDGAVAELEANGPPVPPALVHLWREIGEISLVDLGGFRHMAFWEDRVGGDARTFACDGVVVEGPCGDDAWVDYVVDLFDEQAEIGEPPAYPLSPDALHKDRTSGGASYELVPDAGDPWLASLREFAWCGPATPTSVPAGSAPDLVSYLRTAILECGGFPGLFGSTGFEPLRRELVDGLPLF